MVKNPIAVVDWRLALLRDVRRMSILDGDSDAGA